MEPPRLIEVADARRQHPHPPIRPRDTLSAPFHVDEPVLKQVAGMLQRFLGGEECGTADGKDRVVEQPAGRASKSIECLAHRRMEDFPSGRETHRAACPFNETLAELVLEFLDLVA